MSWFFKKKHSPEMAPAPQGMPAFPVYPDGLRNSQQTTSLPRPPEQTMQRPYNPFMQRESQEGILPTVDTSVMTLPQREPRFLQQQPAYPERASLATGKPFFAPPTLARELPRDLPMGREARGPAIEDDTSAAQRSAKTKKRDGYVPPESLIREMEEEEKDGSLFRRPIERQQPVQSQPAQAEEPSDERPVFVKLEKYREAMSAIESLKQQIKEMDYLLEKIEELRGKEQEELKNAKSDLNKIKDQLVGIDKQLFDV